MEIEINTFETREKWLAYRANFLNSSDAAALFNKGQWGSFYKLWHVKHGDIEDDFKPTKLTKAGLRYEQCTADHFADDYNCEVVKIDEYRCNHEHRIGSSYDFMVATGEFAGWILETKRCISFAKRKWEEGEPPLQYTLQCHQQMALMPDAPGVILCVLIDGWELEPYFIPRDERMIEMIKTKAVKFWGTIYDHQAPEIDLDDIDTVKRVNAKEDGTELQATDHQEALIFEMEHAAYQAKIHEDIKKQAQAKLMNSTKAQRLLMLDGRTLVLKYQEGNPGKVITAEMVGQKIFHKSGFRRCQITGKAK